MAIEDTAEHQLPHRPPVPEVGDELVVEDVR